MKYSLYLEGDNVIVYDDIKESQLLVTNKLYIKKVCSELRKANLHQFERDAITIEKDLNFVSKSFRMWAGKHYKTYALASIHLALCEEISYEYKNIKCKTNRKTVTDMEKEKHF